jgi:lysozyme
MRHISPEGFELIKEWEGCNLDAYLDGGGVPTCGYGHTRGVLLGMSITQEQADELLRDDLTDAEAAVRRLVRVPLTDNQFAALVSLVFNIGQHACAGSTLLQRLNAGNYTAVPEQIRRWHWDNGKEEQGLVNRREAEAQLWSA